MPPKKGGNDGPASFGKSEAKGSGSSLSRSSGGGSRFGKLLSDVTNELIVETDAKYAHQSQVDEAYDIANEWIQEEKGTAKLFNDELNNY